MNKHVYEKFKSKQVLIRAKQYINKDRTGNRIIQFLLQEAKQSR